MTTSAQALIASAAIGSLEADNDARPRPSTRLRRKLSGWRRLNAVPRDDRAFVAEFLSDRSLRRLPRALVAVAA